MSVTALSRSSTRRPRRATEARKAPMPGFVEPCDPTLQERAPTGDGWIFEIKTDGYRAQVHIRNGRLRIPTIVTTRSDASRPPVPIDRDQVKAPSGAFSDLSVLVRRQARWRPSP